MPTLRPSTVRSLAVLVLCSWATLAAAEIHRCKEANGQVVISDRPCGASFDGPPMQSTSAGTTVDRIAAPQMYGSRPPEEGRYDFIPDRNGHNADARSDKASM